MVDLAVAHHLDLEPVGEGVHALGSDPVETARVLVGALAELSSCVEVGQNEFECGDLELGVDVDWDPSAVVPQGAGTVHMQRHIDACTVPGEVFVDGVVEHLKHTVVQPALVCRPDVHPGALAYPGQSLEFVDFGGVVQLLRSAGFGGFG